MRGCLLGVVLAVMLFVGLPALALLSLRPPPLPPLTDRNPLVTFYDNATGRIRQEPLETYLVGVVAAEMPASFAGQALEAQAVVARTYAVAHLRQRGNEGSCPSHPAVDLCTDPREGQAWLSDAQQRRRWGLLKYLEYRKKIVSAVTATTGLIVTYQGQPINAVYHAASGGMTEAARYVWGVDVPYLQSVPSPWEDDPYQGFTTVLTYAQVARALNLPVNPVQPPALRIDLRSPSGRVVTAQVGGRSFAGTDLRQRLGLRSTLFRWRWVAGGLEVVSDGYGHGVGMPQYGAQGMALRGADFRQIISYYYRGVRIQPLQELLAR